MVLLYESQVGPCGTLRDPAGPCRTLGDPVGPCGTLWDMQDLAGPSGHLVGAR